MIFPEAPASRREVVLEQVFGPNRQYFPGLEKKIILLVEIGPRAYGTYREGDGYSVRGVFIPRSESYLGFGTRPTEKIEWTAPVPLCVRQLQAFMLLCLQGTPNTFEILFSDPGRHIISGPIAEQLIDNRDLFLSKTIRWTFEKYAMQTVRDLMRHDLEVSYNNDLCADLVRILRMGLEILQDGKVVVHRPDADELISIRNGEWPLHDLIKWCSDQVEKINQAYLASCLPEEPDRNAVEHLAVELTKRMFIEEWR